MSAILELKETPRSCVRCPLAIEEPAALLVDRVCKQIGNSCFGTKVTNYTVSRYPDCLLKITEDNLRWVTFEDRVRYVWYRCPLCKYETGLRDANYCPSCGVKLLPPVSDKKYKSEGFVCIKS